MTSCPLLGKSQYTIPQKQVYHPSLGNGTVNSKQKRHCQAKNKRIMLEEPSEVVSSMLFPPRIHCDGQGEKPACL
jgi:hypothetical protein